MHSFVSTQGTECLENPSHVWVMHVLLAKSSRGERGATVCVCLCVWWGGGEKGESLKQVRRFRQRAEAELCNEQEGQKQSEGRKARSTREPREAASNQRTHNATQHKGGLLFVRCDSQRAHTEYDKCGISARGEKKKPSPTPRLTEKEKTKQC